jgi:hypothetical protein
MAQAADFGDTRWTLPAEPGCVRNWYLKGFLGITSYDLDGIRSATFKTSNFDILAVFFCATLRRADASG